MKRTLILLLIILLVLILFSSFFWFYEARYFIGRASENVFNPDNSYVFMIPTKAKADNQEKITVTVIILDDRGIGVMGKKVIIDRDPNLKIEEETKGLTNENGKAIFNISSSKTGEYYLQVAVDGKSLKEKAHLSFY